MEKRVTRLWVLLVVSSCLAVGNRGWAQAPDKKLADYFGFQPLELYKLDSRIGNLQLKDLDGDKVERHHRHQQWPVANRPAA